VLQRWSARGVRLEGFFLAFYSYISTHARRALACVFIVSAVPAVSFAQPAQVMVITASRVPVAVEKLASDVVMIDRAAIEASTADSVADLLRREALVQLSRSGGPGQSTGVLLRGAASVNTVVLVDGVRIGSATLGYAQLDALSVAQIERIEVLRGPGSSLYGADAVGGVVQIFTRRGASGLRLDAQAGVGGYGSGEASFGVRGAQDAWDYAVSAGRERSRGVSALRPGDAFGNYNPDTDGFSLGTAQASAGLTPTSGHRIGLTLVRTRLNAQYDGSEFLAPTFAQDASPDFRNRLNTDVAALDWRGELNARMTATARVARSVDDLRSGGLQVERFRTVRERATGQLAWKLGALGELTGALEHLQETADVSAFDAPVRRRINAVVMALSGDAAPWSWQADLRRDDSSDFGGVTTARIGGSFQVDSRLRLRALAGTTFRAPSFNDLYYPGYGVSTLRPERGRSIEIGLNWREGESEASATVWRNAVRDLIGYESDAALCPADAAYSFGCARNLSRARMQGATFAASHLAGLVALKAQLDLVDAKDQLTHQRLNRRAAHQGSLQADWQAGAWTLGASVLLVGSRPDGGAQLPAETTLDFVATWRFMPEWQLQAKLLNATDVGVQPVRDYQGLGRQAWLVLRYGGELK
jgi:vitamin B12 transporter